MTLVTNKFKTKISTKYATIKTKPNLPGVKWGHRNTKPSIISTD